MPSNASFAPTIVCSIFGLDAKASLKTSWELFAARGNYNHGAYKSGDKASAKAEALEKFLLRQGPEFYESIAESIAADRGEEFSRLGVYPSFEDFMTSHLIRNRGVFVTWSAQLWVSFCFHAEGTFARMDEFTKSCSIIVAKQIHFCCLFWPPYHAEVKNKSWFGAQQAFRLLLRDWSVQRVAVEALAALEEESVLNPNDFTQ